MTNDYTFRAVAVDALLRDGKRPFEILSLVNGISKDFITKRRAALGIPKFKRGGGLPDAGRDERNANIVAHWTNNGRSFQITATAFGMSRQAVEQLVRIDKHRCRQQLAYAIERGDVVRPSKCESCGLPKKVHGHHKDYAKPFEVTWLCSKCHADEHVLLRQAT